jgi:NADPH-dependent curcumin reductase CurA
MTRSVNVRQVVLNARPGARPRASDFRLETVEVPAPAEGQILTRTIWLSVDPFMRLSLDEGGLAGTLPLGQTMIGGAVSEVIASNHPDFRTGDIVEGRTGWRDYAVGDGDGPRIVDPGLAPLSTFLGVLGMPGVTAHTGMLTLGGALEGETVVVSAAGGAVGSIAGQIGKIVGCRVVGIAGGPEKCAKVKALGFDACVDYRAPDYAEQLAAACPDGVDLYFENVGGAVSQAVFPLFNYGARMSVCGFIAYYGEPDVPASPDHLPGFYKLFMARGLRAFGFAWRRAASPDALTDLAAWLKAGKLASPEMVYDGLEQAPQAFSDVFASKAGVGKVLIRVGPDRDGTLN